MKSTLSYLLIICSLFTACIGHQEESLLFYVDTRTGTAPSATHTAELFGKNTEEYGQTLPAGFVNHVYMASLNGKFAAVMPSTDYLP